jgi:hypothetical protein
LDENYTSWKLLQQNKKKFKVLLPKAPTLYPGGYWSHHPKITIFFLHTIPRKE